MFSIILDTYIEGVLLDHVVALCLAFSGIGILVFLMFFSFSYYTPTSSIRGCQHLHIFTNILYSLFYYSHPSGDEVVSHCDFVFPND